MTRRHFLHTLGGATALTALAALSPLRALAQAVDQVKIYYGFPPGSAGDSVARRVGEKLAGSPFSKNAAVVENKSGAGGRIALETMRLAPADGSVLALAPVSAMAVYPHIYSKLSYTPKDFVPVSIAAVMHHGLAVGPMVPPYVKTLKDFLAWSKTHPEQASYGSPGAGSMPHLLGALLGLRAQVDLKHVPYRGVIPSITDLVGGQIASTMNPSGDYLSYVKAGRLRVLATSGPKRSPYFPDVPTFAEQGFADLTVEEWFGFYAPAKTPAATVAAANAAINLALKDKSVLDSLAMVGLIARGSSMEAMAKSQQTELERWGPLVKQIGFTAES